MALFLQFKSFYSIRKYINTLLRNIDTLICKSVSTANRGPKDQNHLTYFFNPPLNLVPVRPSTMPAIGAEQRQAPILLQFVNLYKTFTCVKHEKYRLSFLYLKVSMNLSIVQPYLSNLIKNSIRLLSLLQQMLLSIQNIQALHSSGELDYVFFAFACLSRLYFVLEPVYVR
ncbi:hypothetical protein BDF20DRAFT_943381 [Mycotypha africana]|uniref:uncharacterized protein n=1 Tax=Mycotypha africana TaxID=64632 RepID=UPI002301EF45|nr:uncharacterized protein BDF20DRAFT_943381 [Mycotypha africana]KAI8975149.1 hypothetical protein BDF20DRAFT_943381 [Mycotypha africana]